jgi:hypothetical protein
MYTVSWQHVKLFPWMTGAAGTDVSDVKLNVHEIIPELHWRANRWELVATKNK